MMLASPVIGEAGAGIPDCAASRARILLVDDDERNLLALSQVLKDVGEVVPALSGREALRHLLHGEFAVILLDVYMPGLDGYEVADLIRQRRQTSRIPIIFVSAVNKETEHLLRGYAMGAVDYVFKPVDPVILTSKVKVFVDLFDARKGVEAKSRAEQALREAALQAQLERFQIESELNATRARQAAMLEALPLALFEAEADPSGMLSREFIAGDLAKLIGVEAGDLEAGALRWEDRIHEDDVHALCTAAKRQTALSLQYRWTSSDGRQRYFMERAVPVACDEQGNVRWAGTLIDVTEQRLLEAKLVQAGKLDALGQLTGGVAHDFNNVLAAIMGGLRLIRGKNGSDERSRKLIEQMQIAAERGADLVRRMMTFARQQDLAPVIVDPASLCETVSGLVEQTLGGATVLDWTCEPQGISLVADRSQLELTLVNLIINARDAMPDGGRIRVTLAEASKRECKELALEDECYLRIEVSDEGTGIPAHLLERITEPFFTTKEVGKGTGLGLSMAAGFVQQSGGRLDVRSREGVGTTVRLFMPAVKGERVTTGDAAPATELKVAESISVLLVDDDAIVRTMIAEQIRELGGQVIEASNGLEAIELMRTSRVDMLLTDYAMPGMNGLALIEAVRELYPDLRTAAMTGFADDRLTAALADGTAYLPKPIPQGALEALLRKGQS